MIMIEQGEVAFEDWEAEFDQSEKMEEEQELCKKRQPFLHEQIIRDSSVLQKSKGKVYCIEALRTMTNEQFERCYKDDQTITRTIESSPSFLKTEKDFIELSSIVVDRFKKKADQEPEKVVPQNELFTFFQEMLHYLYPKYEWENIQFAKQKLKIVKKDKKEEEIKARKLKQKQERLKRTQIKSESISIELKEQKEQREERCGTEEKKAEEDFQDEYM